MKHGLKEITLINYPSVFEGSNVRNISSTNYRALQVAELEKLREQKKLLLRLIEKLEQSIKIREAFRNLF